MSDYSPEQSEERLNTCGVAQVAIVTANVISHPTSLTTDSTNQPSEASDDARHSGHKDGSPAVSVGHPDSEAGGDNEAPVEPMAQTKMSRAADIYRRMTRKKGTTRKEIVAAFVEEVALTKAGAATYYQMIKKGRR